MASSVTAWMLDAEIHVALIDRSNPVFRGGPPKSSSNRAFVIVRPWQ